MKRYPNHIHRLYGANVGDKIEVKPNVFSNTIYFYHCLCEYRTGYYNDKAYADLEIKEHLKISLLERP